LFTLLSSLPVPVVMASSLQISGSSFSAGDWLIISAAQKLQRKMKSHFTAYTDQV